MTSASISTDPQHIKRALISVSDKTNVLQLGQALQRAHIEILSTGGTAKHLREAGIPVTDVSTYTGFPEMMGGRIKTLHPKIHGAILARRDCDAQAMQQAGITGIDLVVVNLYPFAQVAAQPDCSFSNAIEHIDIGGPTMVRAAAKNHAWVSVVTDPQDYPLIIENLPNGIPLATRQVLARKAFAHTAHYDLCIANWFDAQDETEALPSTMRLDLPRSASLRYGENPHQTAASYRMENPQEASVLHAHQHQGKALSFNNLVDSDAALECIKAFAEPCCVIVKHANPCGVACGANLQQAYERAYQADPQSAFGGIIAFNQSVDAALAQTIINRQFVEVIIAPDFSKEALVALQDKPNIRALSCTQPFDIVDIDSPTIHSVYGGVLLQSRDTALTNGWQVVSQQQPDETTTEDLLFAWKVAKSVKSNAIVYARDKQTIGIGAGQMSRVYSARIAAIKAQDESLEVKQSVMASDAFFPFRDGIDAAAAVGVRAVIHPGGSMRDAEVIAAANEHKMVMVFTGMRHFRH